MIQLGLPVIVALLTSGCGFIEKVNQQSYFTQLESKAASGDISAQLELGTTFELGDSTNKDTDSALHWYREAASGGSTEAAYRAAILLQTMDTKNPEEILRLLEQASIGGYGPAQLELADRLAQQLSLIHI